MAIDFETWKKKREEDNASPASQFERWKAWKSSGDKSSSFASYEKKQKMLSGGLQPEDEAYNEWLDALNSYADKTSADYRSRENKYQDKSVLGRYNIDAAAHSAQFRTGAQQLRDYYTKNRDLYDEIYGSGTVDNILASLDSGSKYLDDLGKGLKSEREYWGQWDDGATYRLAKQAAKEQERAEQAQAAFVSEDSDGYKSYGDKWARYVELSQKQSLTKEEKAEAKAAMEDMQSKYRVVNQSDVFYTDMPSDMEKVYIDLTNKSNWGAGVTAGFMDAFGVDWLMDKGSELVSGILGRDMSEDTSVQEQFEGIKAAHPGAYIAGNVGGNVVSLLTAGKLIGAGTSAISNFSKLAPAVQAGTSAISGFSKLAPAVQKAVTSGLTFGLTGGYQAVTNTLSEPEWNKREQEVAKYYAQQGIRYNPVDYNAWSQVGDVLKQALISTVGGVAGSFAGSLVGDLGKAFLVKKGLQTPLAEALRQTLSGTAFAAGNTLSTYWLYPEESRPSKEKIAQDLTVAFIFSAITSTVSTMQTTKANKTYIDNAVSRMKQDYQNTLNGSMTPAEQIAALDDILAYNAQIRAAIKQNYYAGQQSYINEILQGMDAIDEQINIIKNGMASGSAPSGASNGPATVPQDAPTAPNPTVGNMPSVVSPVVPQGQAIDPNAYPAIIAQAMQLDPSTKANQIATAINNGELALSDETMIELEAAIAEAPNSTVDLRSAANEIAGIAEDDNGVPVVDTEKVRPVLADHGIEHGEIVDEEKFNNDPFTKTIDTLDGKKPNNTTMQDMPASAPVATPQNAPAKPLHNKSSILDTVKQSGAVNVPYDQILRNVSDAVEAGAVSSAEVSDAYAAGLAEYNKKDVVNNAPITADKESAAVVYAFDDDGKFIQESITDATNRINANAYAKEVEAQLSSTNRYVDNGIVYRITGNDKDGYIAAVYRSDAEGNISNARSQLYTERGLATRQDAVDALVGVSRSLAPKEGLQEATASDNINLQDVVDNGTLPEQGASAQTGNVLGGTQSANTAKESADNGSERVDEGRGTVRGGSSGGRTGAVSETKEVAAQSGDSKRSGNSGEIRVRDDGEKGSGDGGRINGLLGGNGSGKGLLTGSNAGGDGTADGKDHAGLSEKASVEKPSKKKLNKQNYRIVEDIDSKRPNYNDNLEAIKLVKRLEADGRKATAEERAILARYKGWGGLKQDILGWKSRELKQYLTNDEYEAAKASILNAHYTSTKIIAGMYKAISRMGFTGGNVLEPSMGVGNFFGMMPNSLASASTLYGVELDNITGLIAKHLYPDAEIHVAGFQDVLYPDDTFDLVVGNVPFSNDIKIPYRGTSFNLHDFFFVKSLDEMKSGGVAALITSTGTLDKISGKTQSAIAKRANLIAAFRLPDNAFSTNAGTSVTTDLIFLQKKGGGIEDNGVEFTHIGDINGIPINEYYAQHPKNILGELAYEKNMYQSERVVVHAMDSFENSFNNAINSLPKGIMSADGSQPSVVKVKHRGDKGKKTFTVTSEGAAIVDTDGNAEKISDKNASIVKGFIEVKQAYFSVIDAERAGNLTAADEYRKRLNTVYDAFAKKHGSISSNKRLLKQDDDFTRVSGLEVIQDKGAATKSAIFSMPTVSKAKKTSADTSEEALSITLNEDGNVDIERISQLTGKSRDTVLDELKDEVIFTPDGEYVLMAKYLSGNIYEKLAAVKGKNGFEKHEALLRATIPTPKQAKDITAEFGSHWIPEKYIAEFVSSAFKSYGRVVVEYSKELGTWEVSKFGTQSTKYSTDRVSAPDIVKNTLNGKNIAVYDTIDEHRVLNKKATEAAQQKQNDLRQDFSKWIFEDDTRRADLERIFNETLNAYAPMQYKGLSDRINFGISPKSKIKLRSYQKEGVARIVYGGNTLLHHGVGTGKTATMIAAAHVLKQTGIANKPMFVVPNGKVNDFRNEILDMYPYANVLALDDKSTTPAELQRTKSMIATGDYDYIIIYRTAFQKIAVSPETEAAFIQAQLDDLERAIRESGASKNGSTMFEKNLIARKKTLEEKLKAALDKPKDNTINFEDTGIDALFIDEAHNFKKVGFATTHNVSGIDSSTNNMTTDLYMKENYLRNRGARIVLATATPLTNTLSEMYNMTMHVNPDVLRDVGIYSFDGWLNTFADIQSQPEIAPDGKTWRMKERVRGFKSGNEMVGLYRQFADVKQTKDVVKELPKAKYVDVVCKGTDIHQALLDSFADRSAKKDPKDNMLVISNDGRAAGADLRLLTGVLQETYPGITETELDLQESKINRSVGNILDEYHGSMKTNGTQFVFLDVGVHSGGGRYSFNLYTDLINKLVAAGIPRTEIANIQDYDGETKRTELYDAMNTGKIRVLIGSTAKMGEGVNAQNKAVALHHLSVPFRPDNLEQREGRIVRNGNENKNVTIYRYIQEKSFDSYLWQMIERKAAYVAQALNGGDASDLEENGEAIVNAREAKAIATGNPLIMEKFTLQDKVNRLKMLRSSFYDEQRRAAQKVASSESDIASVKKILAAAKKDAATVENNKTDELRIKIGNTIYDNRKKAGDALQKEQRVGKIGEVYGLNIYRATSDKVYLKGEQKYSDTELGDSSEGNITRILNATASPAQTVRWSTDSIKEKEASFEDAQEVLNRKFAKQDELDNAVARLFEVDTELGIIQNEVNFDEMAVSETEGGDNEVSNLISTDTSKQAISSADTSINSGKLPAVFNKVKFVPGTVNLDIGGGKFDNATLFLKEQGVTSYIYDPYNRTPDHNNKSAAATQNGQSDTVTVSNVLNVIKEADARSEVLLNAVDAVKQNGIVYITIYEGDGKGIGRTTKMKDGDASCWQEHRRTSSYIPEVKRYFKDVTVKNGVIIAKAPYKKALAPKKQSGNSDYLVSASDAAATWKVFRSVATPGADKWSATRVGDTSKAVMRISDIISKIRHDFGIPVEKGRMPRRDIAGKYDRHSHSIQTRIVNDLPTVAHELGHHLDNSYDITDGVSKELHNELVDQLDAAMKAEYPADKLRTEGFAEFIRRYMQNKETAAIDYPLFTPYFREKVDPDVMSAVDGFADEINAYYSLDAETAQSSIRDYGEGPRDFRTVKEKTSDEADKLYQAWIDIFHGIKLFDRAAGTTTHMLAINSAYADSVAYSILTRELTDINGKRVSSGLQQALNGINLKDKNEYKAFNEYLIVRHAPERLAEGMRIFPDDRKNSTAWMNARQTVLEQQHPEFEHAADRLYAFQKQFLQTWGVQTGLVDRDSAEQWAERWQYYVPFNRAIAKQSRIGAKRGFANQNSTIKRARGSGEDFYNPVDNIINNMVKMVNAAIRNNVMLAIRKSAIDAEGMALFLERVPAPIKRNVYNVSALKQSIVEQVTDASLTSDDTEKVFGIIDGMDDVLVQYERGKASGNVIAVLVGGKPEYWKINDPLLLESLTNMSQNEVGAVLHALGTVSRFMTANITGLNLIWSIGSNTVRDLGTLLTFSKDKNLVHAFGGIFKAYINSVRKPDNQDPMYKEFLAMGGGSESVYTADKNMTKDIKDKLTGKKIKWLNPLEWIEVVSNIIERGPRYATYKMMRDRGMTPQQAIYESHDITVNFRRGGTISRQINKAVPFFNAGVQGIDKLLRWITCEDVPQGERAKAVRSRVMQYFAAFGILGALQWFINSRDEEAEKYYAQLSTYTKNNFWCLPIYENGKATGEYVTIPKPRELAIPASLVSALLEYGISRNDDAFHEFDEYALGSYLPNIADDAVKGIVGIAKGDMAFTDVASSMLGNLGIIGVASYMVSNRDFLGKPIESAYYQNLEPRDRYNSRTSKAAYAIGQAFNMSPIMIDYALQNFLGGFWKTQKALFPVDPNEADYSMGLGSTYRRDSQHSTDLVNVMYDTKQAAYLAKNSDPDNIGKAIAYKESNNMTTFYSRFNKLDGGDSSTRQIVLDMIYDFNKAVNGDYRTELQKKMDVLCEKVGNTEAILIAVQPFVKDDDGTSHELTAAEYVEYQSLFNGLYWKYVAKALNTSTDYRKQYIAVMEARSMAVDEARATMLSRMSVGSEDYTNIIGANQVGLTSEDTMLFRAALEAADAQTDGNLKQDEFLDVLNAADFTDEQKAFLYSTEGNYSTQGNVWLTAGEINDWIAEKRSTGKKDSEIASGITEVYKDLYLEYWAAGNQQGMNEIAEKLMSLDLRNKDYMPYYSYDIFLKWIEDYMNQ